MKKTIAILTAIIISGFFSGCNDLKKMVKRADEVNRTVTPNPLEMHAGKVPIKVTVTFPAKYFGKKVKLVIMPKLVADGNKDSVEFNKQTLIGEKFKDQGTVIPYKEGGTFSFEDTVEYKDVYRSSELTLVLLASDSKGKFGKTIRVPMAKGVITTPELVQKGLMVDVGANMGKLIEEPIAKPKITTAFSDAKIYFSLQNAQVKNTEMRKKEIDSLITLIKRISEDSTKEIKAIKISSYASPDGPIDLNTGLSEDRGKNSQKALENALKKAKIELNENFEIGKTSEAEDWEGFKALVSSSDIKDKDAILNVVSMYPDHVKREEEIKKLAKAYLELAKDVLPMLRRSIVKVEYSTKVKEDSELLGASKSNPQSLNKEELLYTASITKDANDQETVYKSYTSQYPNDWRGWNNLGAVQAKKGNFSEAKVNFQKTLDAGQNTAAAYNNLGAVELGEGNDEKAWEYFTKSLDEGCTSNSLKYNMGVIQVKRAQYSDAVSNFSAGPASFNLALAQTLTGDNSSADGTLKSVGSSDEAIFYYLKAVVAARADAKADALENLRMAVKKDSNLKDYAKKDLEFRKYFGDTDFTDIVE